jgi:hypothetical protein
MKTKMPISTDTVTEEDIAGMLQKIPPHPEYSDWMKILSAVFSVLPLAQGARVLNAWSPEKSEGEYFRKHQQRLKQVGIGTLVMLAKKHGWAGSKSTRKRNVLIRQAPTPTRRNTPPTWLAQISQAPANSTHLPPSTPPHTPATEIDMSEAQRIADELLKIHNEGLIEGPNDPSARLYARALQLFKATFSPIAPSPASQVA